MEITSKDLRIKSGKIIDHVAHGAEVIVTYRGRRAARIVPFVEEPCQEGLAHDEIFGLWKDHKKIEDVNEYVRNIRKGRKF